MGSMIGHARLLTGPPLALVGVVILASLRAVPVATVSGLQLETTRLQAAVVVAVGLPAKAGGAGEHDSRTATTAKLKDVQAAENWTGAGAGVTLTLLLCVLLTQVTVLRPRGPTEASSFFPS